MKIAGLKGIVLSIAALESQRGQRGAQAAPTVTREPAPAAVAPPAPVPMALPIPAAGKARLARDLSNAMTVINQGPNAITVGFFQNNAPDSPGFASDLTIALDPGTAETVTLPFGWSGRVQKLTGSVSDPATWGEVTFNGWQNLVFMDVSYIRGNNGAMTLGDSSGPLSGTSEDLLDEAPGDLQTTDSNGNTILPATEGYDGSIDWALIGYYAQHGNGDGFVQSSDTQFIRASSDPNVVVTLY